MKITCQSCQAKYTIADEKVAGKTVKIKCKKCGATIVVNGNDPAVAAAPPTGLVAAAPPGGDDDDGDGATRVFAEGSPGAPQGPGAVEWTVNVTDEDQRTMSAAQIVAEYQRGVVTNDTYVWKDGMADWLPLSGVPELVQMVSVVAPRPAAGAPAMAPAPAPAQAPAPAVMPEPVGGLGGTMIMAETPTPLAASATAPAAARRKAPAAGVDLFGPGAQQESAPAPAAASATTNASRLAGERNENSVLFSISALTAAAAATKKGEDAILDLASPSPAPRNGRRDAVDDIMNLGGGIAAAPVLAPPPLLAPVVEAPPPPAPVAAAPAMAMPMGIPDAPQKKSKTGLIIGLVAGVAVLGGVGAFFAMNGSKPAGAEATNATATTASVSAAAQTPSAAPTAPAGDTKPADAKPADTGATADTKPADDKKDTKPADDKKVGGGTGAVAVNTGAGKPDKKDDKKEDKKADDKKADSKPADDKKADSKPADTGGGGGKEFDRAAALAALGGAAGAARSCKTADGPTGSGKVKVTFAPSGNVTSATLESGPWAGTPMVGCIVGAFRGAHVPAFDGAPVSVSKSISIN